MMKTTFFSALGALLLCANAVNLHATDGPAGNRPECVTASIPRSATWTVTYTYPEELGAGGDAATGTATPSSPAAAAAPRADLAGRIRSVITARLGDVTHVAITKISSEGHDMWATGTEEYGKAGSSTDWVRVQSGPGEAKKKTYTCPCAFPGTEWATQDLLVGKVQYQGVECNLYMPKPHPTIDVNDARKLKQLVEKAPFIALIDTKTRYPLEVHEGGIRLVFDFKPAPKTLELPDDLVAQIGQGARVRMLMNVRAPRPY